MGLAVGNVILASDFIAIKQRVKLECARRKYVGSVEEYASASYDFTVVPTAGGIILPEHWNKIVTPINQITDTGYSTKTTGEAIPSLVNISNILAGLENSPTEGTSSGCKSSCTGLCQGTCSEVCTGCTGGCASTCSQSCTGGCSGCSSCSGSCVGGCRTEACKGGCSSEGCKGQHCKTNCSAFCTNNTRIADN